MFTKNWYVAIWSYLTSTSTIGKNVQGNNVTINPSENYPLKLKYDNYPQYVPSVNKLRNSLSAGGGVILGTGTTPPTLDDYMLSGDLITTFTSSSTINITNNPELNEAFLTTIFTITNSGTDAFTIGEIGLIGNIKSNNTGTSVSDMSLLERTVLDSPVTIEASGVGQVTYTIRFNYPTE